MSTLVRNTTLSSSRRYRYEALQSLPGRDKILKSISYRRRRAKQRKIFLTTYHLSSNIDPFAEPKSSKLNKDIQDDEGSITSFPCTAGSTFYAPPLASSVVRMLQEVGTQNLLSRSFVLKKLYTSDDELDELDSPFSALGMNDSSPISKKNFTVIKGAPKVVRYELLREVWRSTE